MGTVLKSSTKIITCQEALLEFYNRPDIKPLFDLRRHILPSLQVMEESLKEYYFEKSYFQVLSKSNVENDCLKEKYEILIKALQERFIDPALKAHFTSKLFELLEKTSFYYEGKGDVRGKLEDKLRKHLKAKGLKDVKDYYEVLNLKMTGRKLINIFEICTNFVLDNGAFLFALCLTDIRELFRYSALRVKDITKFGFRESPDAYYVLYYEYRGITYCSSVLSEQECLFYEKQHSTEVRHGKLKRKKITYYSGIDRVEYERALEEEYAEFNNKLKEVRKVAHKAHKNAKIYLDENGEKVTAFAYASRNNKSKSWATARLKRLQGEVK